MEFKRISALTLVFLTSLTGCSFAPTYRSVVQQDVHDYYAATVKNPEQSYAYSVSDNKITRSFIFVNGVIVFDIDLFQKWGIYQGIGVQLKYDKEDSDDMMIDFPSQHAVFLAWYKHNIYRLDLFLDGRFKVDGKKFISKQDFLKIKEMYDNNENDFTFLDKEYIEE